MCVCVCVCVSLFVQEAVRIMAKDLVRTRNYIKKFYLMKANIQAISLKLQVLSSSQLGYSEPWCELIVCVCVVFCSQTMRSQAAMAKAMKGVSKVGNEGKGVHSLLWCLPSFPFLCHPIPPPISLLPPLLSPSRQWQG